MTLIVLHHRQGAGNEVYIPFHVIKDAYKYLFGAKHFSGWLPLAHLLPSSDITSDDNRGESFHILVLTYLKPIDFKQNTYDTTRIYERSPSPKFSTLVTPIHPSSLLQTFHCLCLVFCHVKTIFKTNNLTTISCNFTIHHITLHYITLHYITVHYITLHFIHYMLRNIILTLNMILDF